MRSGDFIVYVEKVQQQMASIELSLKGNNKTLLHLLTFDMIVHHFTIHMKCHACNKTMSLGKAINNYLIGNGSQFYVITNLFHVKLTICLDTKLVI